MKIATQARLAIRPFCLIVALALTSLATHAATAPAFEWIKLQENASSADAINIIISSEGYTSSQRAMFLADAQLIVNGFANKEPWKTYISHVNFYAGWVVSNQEGISVVGSTQVDTAFKGTLDLNPPVGQGGLILNDAIVYAYMTAVTVTGQHIFIVNSAVQSPRGDSPGGLYAAFLRDPATSNNLIALLALHETGHSIAGLSDEYMGGGDLSPLKNKTYDLTNIPWRLWPEPGIPLPTPDSYATDTLPDVTNCYQRVGAYAAPTATFYRPTYASIMKGGDYSFGPVNSEAIILAIYAKTGPMLSVTPTAASSVRILSGQQQVFTPNKWAAPATITTKWYLNDSTTSYATTDTLTIKYADLTPGTYTLKCVVKDSTTMVRNDPQNLTQDTVSWTVTIGDMPLITQQPTDVSVTAGQLASFSVTATGSNLTYQWRKAGVAITGATAATCTISSTSASDAGSYTCVVTNGSGSASSTAATLTVAAAPSSGGSGGGGGACGEWYFVAISLSGLVRYWQKRRF